MQNSPLSGRAKMQGGGAISGPPQPLRRQAAENWMESNDCKNIFRACCKDHWTPCSYFTVLMQFQHVMQQNNHTQANLIWAGFKFD